MSETRETTGSTGQAGSSLSAAINEVDSWIATFLSSRTRRAGPMWKVEEFRTHARHPEEYPCLASIAGTTASNEFVQYLLSEECKCIYGNLKFRNRLHGSVFFPNLFRPDSLHELGCEDQKGYEGALIAALRTAVGSENPGKGSPWLLADFVFRAYPHDELPNQHKAFSAGVVIDFRQAKDGEGTSLQPCRECCEFGKRCMLRDHDGMARWVFKAPRPGSTEDVLDLASNAADLDEARHRYEEAIVRFRNYKECESLDYPETWSDFIKEVNCREIKDIEDFDETAITRCFAFYMSMLHLLLAQRDAGGSIYMIPARNALCVNGGLYAVTLGQHRCERAHSRSPFLPPSALVALGSHIVSRFGSAEAEQSLLSATVRAAAAAILARNMSHHIGSHVMPRTHLDDLRARVEDLILPVFRGAETSRAAQRLLAEGLASGGHDAREPALETQELIDALYRSNPRRCWQSDDWEKRAFPPLKELRETLDDYVQRKSEFIAEFSTDPLISTRAASFYREVILPFVRNTALTDTLAANEGFRYLRDARPGLVVRCFVAPPGEDPKGWWEAEEIRSVFYPEAIEIDDEPGDDYLHPPYGMRFADYPGRDVLTEVRGALDPRVALPGPVGEMALYGILENIIRNAAKHGARQGGTPEIKGTTGTDGWDPLEVHVVLRDEDTEGDCYSVRVYENRSGPPPKGDDEVLRRLQNFTKESIIDETGQPRKEAWGTAEMTLCADLLRGVRPGEGDNHGLDVAPGVTVQKFIRGRTKHEKLRLVYSFAIRKARTAVFFGFDMVSNEVREALKPLGFRFEPASRLFDRDNRELPAAFRFAVLNAGALESTMAGQNTDEAACVAYWRLPFRVLICGASEKVAERVSKTLPVLRAQPLPDAPPFGARENDAGALVHWLWQSWLRGLAASLLPTGAASVDLYFHQDARTQPTARWAASAETYNGSQEGGEAAPAVRVWARSDRGVPQCITPRARAPRSGEMRVVVDRHGALVSASQVFKPSPDDCIMVIDKSSSDFNALYNSTFDAPWSLPYEIAEAGLLRILVIDERIAQHASAWYPAIDKDRAAFREAMTGSENEAPRLHHVAQRAGVFIATHVVVEGAGENDLSLDLACRDWRVEALPKSSDARWLRFKASTGGRPARGPSSIDVSFGRLPDLVVLHQGVIDLVRDRVGADIAKALLETLAARCWIVVESGRGIPPEVQEGSEKFLSFSLIEHAFRGKQVAKLELVRQLMEVTRNRTK